MNKWYSGAAVISLLGFVIAGARAYGEESGTEYNGIYDTEKEAGRKIYNSGIDTEYRITSRYDRSFGMGAGAGVNAAFTLNKFFYIHAAAAYEYQAKLSNLQLALSVNSPLPFIPGLGDAIRLYFLYYFSALPDYQTYSNSFIPALCIQGKRGGLITGYHARITEFEKEFLSERTLSFKAFLTLLSGEWGHIQCEWANFDDYSAGNSGAWFLALNGRYMLTKNRALTLRLACPQSGGVGLAANFYGITLWAGARFSW